jgi:hypothetical protein
MSELMKVNEVDGFEAFEAGVEGEQAQGRGVIQGTCMRFTNQAMWVINDGDELPADLELVVVDIARVVQKWRDQQPIETRILAPGEKFPDIKKLNEETPKSEWVEGPDGQMRGPWQSQHVVYMLNPATMDRYTWPTGTVGGSICVRDVVDKTNWMRSFRGSRVYPVVTLSDKFMNTRFGGRQRPHFIIKRWIKLGGEGGEVEALPPPKPALQTTSQSDLPLNEVKEPSLAEEMDDEIPDFGSENVESPKAAAPPLPNPRRNRKKPPAKTSTKATGKRHPNILDAG